MVKMQDHIMDVLSEVMDPEIPVLSIIDLGILRDVSFRDDQVVVTVTPTYTACPAMDVIIRNISNALVKNGYINPKINMLLSPAWTTDWMTESGKEKLRAYGIAAPVLRNACNKDNIETVQCPQCRSENVSLISRFGSTACKALYKCNDCMEPFDYFKCH